MKVIDFLILKKNCDNIILKNINDITISNNALNIIKGHPHHVSAYKKSFFKISLDLILYIFKNFIYFFLATIKGYTFKKKNKKKVSVLLISSLVNINQLKKKRLYFF